MTLITSGPCSARTMRSLFFTTIILIDLLSLASPQSIIQSGTSGNGIIANTVTFDYTIGAWRVGFNKQSLTTTTIFIVQTCVVAEFNCDSVDFFESTNVMTCNTLLDEMRASPWRNSVAQYNDTICSKRVSLVEKQELYSATNNFMTTTTPLSVLVSYTPEALHTYARAKMPTGAGNLGDEPSIYDLQFRVLVVEFINIDADTVHASVTRIQVELHTPVDYVAEILLENACVARGLKTPRNGMLVPVRLHHNVIACVARCNWRYIPVPWNTAATLAVGVLDMGKCVPIPHQFSAVVMHIELVFPGIVSASLLPQSALDGVDILALGIQNNSANLTSPIVVCRVPGSYTAGLEFSFLLHKFGQEHDDASFTMETRRRPVTATAIDEHLYAECLLITTDLLEPYTAEATLTSSVDDFVKQNDGVIRIGEENVTDPTYFTNLTLGDARVVSVTRRAQTTVTLPPRINLDLQRFAIISLQIVVVLATATALAGRGV